MQARRQLSDRGGGEGFDQYPFFNYLTKKPERFGKLSMVTQSEKWGSTEPPTPPSGGPDIYRRHASFVLHTSKPCTFYMHHCDGV